MSQPVAPAGSPAPDAAALYRALLDGHPEPTFSLDGEGRLLTCNRAFAHFVGHPPERVAGRALADLVLGAQRSTAERAWERAREGWAQSFQAEFEGPDETVSVGYVTIAPVAVDGRVAGAQGVARDITVYQVIEEQLQARVFTDPLTGLANRDQLLEAVARACRRAEPPGRVAVLFLDLDDFKVVNDALGHTAGDALLTGVGDRLRTATRGGDVVARLGGDEFAVLLDGLAAPGDVEAVVDRVRAALGKPVAVEGRPVTAAASMGIAHWDGSATAAELVRNADLAMYHAKRLGKNRHALYDARMHAAARDRLELASDLRAALAGDPDAGAVTAAFQPIVELATGRVVKAEVLARWSHPRHGAVSPGVFIPVAEDMGLIDELGTHMLRLGCAQLRTWQDAAAAAGAEPVGVTVNVSGRSLDAGTVGDAVRAALAESGAQATGLTVELTESVAMRDPARVLAALTDLAAIGWARRSTTSAPGTRRSPTCTGTRCGCSRSTRASWTGWTARRPTRTRRRWCARWCSSRGRWDCRRWPRGSRRRRSRRRCASWGATSGRATCSGGPGPRRPWRRPARPRRPRRRRPRRPAPSHRPTWRRSGRDRRTRPRAAPGGTPRSPCARPPGRAPRAPAAGRPGAPGRT
jgi:diguanylate cyclase (GGDEF)-like protein/PAS domain S-box-containing protein